MKLELEYDKPIRITREQYVAIKNRLTGIVATRVEGVWPFKKYYVKLWMTAYGHHLTEMLR
jgi:hypothetical protein